MCCFCLDTRSLCSGQVLHYYIALFIAVEQNLISLYFYREQTGVPERHFYINSVTAFRVNVFFVCKGNLFF